MVTKKPKGLGRGLDALLGGRPLIRQDRQHRPRLGNDIVDPGYPGKDSRKVRLSFGAARKYLDPPVAVARFGRH